MILQLFEQAAESGGFPLLRPVSTSRASTPPKYAEYLAANIAENELHVFEGAGHMLMMERAADVSEAIEAFYQCHI